MAEAKKLPSSAKAAAFAIEDGIAVPPRTKEVPDYGIPFDGLKKSGQSLLIPFSAVPVEHARLLVQRYMRQNEDEKTGEKTVVLVTRTEKAANGDTVGLRVWRQ